jgi:hypothetical protein
MSSREHPDCASDGSCVRNGIDVMPITKSSYIMSHYPRITYQKRPFFSTVAMVLCTLAAAFIVGCTAMILHGLHLTGERANAFASLAEEVVHRLPVLCESLPPALTVGPNDRRRLDYCRHLVVTAEAEPTDACDGRILTTVKVTNEGAQAVSLLSLRIVVLNCEGEILEESNEWAATPILAEPHWRGPLLPGCRRDIAFAANRPFPASSLKGLKTEVEITDIRICTDQDPTWIAESRPSPSRK